MSKVGNIASNVLTAAVTAAATSLFWIVAYSGSGSSRTTTSNGDEPARASIVEASTSSPRKDVPVTGNLVIGPTGLAIPVQGIAARQLVDTYSQARAGGARRHDAIDIMAPAGTPVLAAAPGTVEKLYFSKGGGGISAYVRSGDRRWSYYYAHLQAYASNLREGQKLKRGDAIGTVGWTGNANPAGPHLHFAIHRMEPGERWHEGTAINPYPLLAGKSVGR